MKRLLIFLFFLVACCGAVSGVAQVYVAPGGNDFNPGTIGQPKASLASALRQVREMRRVATAPFSSPIQIILQQGVYYLDEPIFIRPEDGGNKNSPTLVEAAAGADVVLSGGVKITGWKKLGNPVEGIPEQIRANIWTATIPTQFEGLPLFRQLWINENKATRAKWPNGRQMARILSWDKKNETCQIPAPPVNISNTSGMEMFIHQWWEIAILRLRKMTRDGDSARLFFKQPESRLQSEHPWPAPWLSQETGNSAFFLSNAIELLDEPGEWFADARQGKIYYWPRQGEDMNTAIVMVPYLENIVNIEGTIDHPVSHVHFKNISFQHTGWNRPSLQGHVPHQTGMPMTDAYKLRPAGTKEKASLENQAWITRPEAAVKISHARHTSFEGCSFQHLASTGLDYNIGAKDNIINGNLFSDIGGNAILGGVFSEDAFEIHLPYNPKDERVVCDSLTITNNFITDATNEDWGALGIGLGYTRNATVSHNEIENVNYSGISMGWGWSPQPNVMKNNRVTANKIHHFGKQNYDCAGIYTLSAQPGSLVSENYIDSIFKAPYAHLPSHWFYLYTDEGSSYITIKNNWTPTKKYLQNNNGPGNQWQNNGPGVSENIKLAAGLQPAYRHFLAATTNGTVKQPIATEHEEVVELVMKDKSVDIKRLKLFLKSNGIDPDRIFQLKNRVVVFDKIQDLSVLQGRLKNEFPEAEVRPYYNMFYQFQGNHCPGNGKVQDLEPVVLTANLVAGSKKQQEFLEHFEGVSENYPEIERGLCEASVQQALGFKNGNQIVMVLKFVNPEAVKGAYKKVVKDRTGFINWEKIMPGYLEAIPGAGSGKTWQWFKNIR